MPEHDSDSPETTPRSGGWYGEPLAYFDRRSSLWKTSQGYLFEDFQLFSEAWPVSGMTRNGRLYERPRLALRIGERVSLLWPTPIRQDAGSSARHWYHAGHPGTTLTDAVRMWRTPAARDYKGQTSVRWRTRLVGDNTATLPDQLLSLRDQVNSNTIGNRPVVLNPHWVLALMGFPVDWLDRATARYGEGKRSKRSATRSYRRLPNLSHSASERSSKELHDSQSMHDSEMPE